MIISNLKNLAKNIAAIFLQLSPAPSLPIRAVFSSKIPGSLHQTPALQARLAHKKKAADYSGPYSPE